MVAALRTQQLCRVPLARMGYVHYTQDAVSIPYFKIAKRVGHLVLPVGCLSNRTTRPVTRTIYYYIDVV